jgi:hypothetical protein
VGAVLLTRPVLLGGVTLRGPFQAPAVAIWCRWSLVRLWVAISNRHSVRTASDTDLDYLDSTSISAEFVNRQLGRSRSLRKVLFLDCCYSGAFSEAFAAGADRDIDFGGRFEGRGQVVLTASSAMEYAFEGETVTGQGQPAVFTSALVKGLKTGEADLDSDGRISLDELYDYVCDEVLRVTSKQTPRKWGSDIHGSIFIARSTRKPAPTAPGESALGVTSGKAETTDRYFVVPDEELEGLSARVDLRPDCPRVYDQGQVGSSVGQAVAGALEFSRNKHGAATFTPSRLFIYFNAPTVSGLEDSDSGATIRSALQTVDELGAPPRSCGHTRWRI